MNENEPQFSGTHSYNMPQKQPKRLALAIMSFVFSFIPILMCCCNMFTPITVFLILVCLFSALLGVLSLALHRDGKGFAIAGIIISGLALIPLLFSLIFLRGVNEDMMTFSREPQKYIDQYEETGEVPEEFSEYEDPKYDWLWRSMGISSFDEFYAEIIRQYKEQYGWMLESSSGSSSSRSESSKSSDSSSRPANYGEDPITI